jgi:hypothetical protein
MAISKKASVRRTSPERQAAGEQAVARKRERQKAEDTSARARQSAQRFGKSGAKAIQAHIQARGQRKQARRDSR